MANDPKNQNNYAFIDASNLFYGGEKSLGWKIDYQKLLGYLKDKYGISRALYFGGAEIHKFRFDYMKNETVPIAELEKYLIGLIKERGSWLSESELILLGRHLQRIRFYLKLDKFGYELHLKPVKLYDQDDGTAKKKANCDVDMAFWLMKEADYFNEAVILSGDGDFLPVLKYLKNQGKNITILSRGPRTAREIRQFAGSNFRDFTKLENRIKFMEP
jgi:uncharacterized LabA/DUF88 family protein